MRPRTSDLVVIWDDVVSLRELLLGIVLGVTLSAAAYWAASKMLPALMPGLAPGLLKGYTMLCGVLGAVLSGAVTSCLFKPKREFELAVAGADVIDALRQLGVNPAEEAAALKSASPSVLRELEQLQLLAAFQEYSSQPPGENHDR